LKGLLTVRIDQIDSGDELKRAMNTMLNACQQGRGRVNHDARIRIASFSTDNQREIQSHIGDLVWFAKDREPEEPVKKKGFWRHILEDDW